ncbi:hypothetical protein, partial [Salmonella enterica]|uniref:hypothetical protein n=1 Tax=Salmonella enterica TaxID=28901 RepID=UPI003523DD7D
MLNATVNSATNFSALKLPKMPAISVGDYIAANVDGIVMHGFFAGYTQQNRASVIVRERHNPTFTAKIVHPVHIKLLHYRGTAPHAKLVADWLAARFTKTKSLEDMEATWGDLTVW